MAGTLIASLLSLGAKLLPSIRASTQAPSSSSSNNDSETGRAVEDLEKLMRNLERIKATLYDAEEREIRDRSVKLWLKELKKVVYDSEDVLSEYRYEVTRVQVEARKASYASGTRKRKQMEYIVPIPASMVDRLYKLRNRFDEIAKDREALHLRESDGVRHPNNRVLRPPSGHIVDEGSLFGRDAEIEMVINLLLSEEKIFSVISIIGKGGLGKTTIAQAVYKDGTVRSGFDLVGWVCVSEDFNVARMIKATIESFTKNSCALSELSSLQEELVKTVKEKKMLLVLDDVWNENQNLWELFWVSFKEAKLVRILVTTRNEKVAEVMQTTAIFRPTYLPDDSCWQLFQHYAFGGTSHTMPTHFVKMGRKIMKKCGGLALAVKSIASLLRHETDEESWREILESDLWESNSSNDIFSALQISYAHLPAYLKPCFLFCSMYPKDHRLKKNNLIELWISHGYVESRGKRRIREVGAEYYKELIERSFLDDISDGFSEFCKLHDVIHDLARLNSEKEHYSVKIREPIDIDEENIPQQVYHLYVSGFMVHVNSVLNQNLTGLRTLCIDLSGFGEVLKCVKNEIITNFTKCEALRVLELENYPWREIPDSIAKLKHVSHLRITSSYLEVLPQSIGLLYDLQTLILECRRSPLKYIPKSIGDLANLQYLYIECPKVRKLPNSLWSLGNLLRLVIKSDDLVKVPSDLTELRNLEEIKIVSLKAPTLPSIIGFLSSSELLNFNSCGSLLQLPCCLLNYNPQGLVNFPAIKKMVACLMVRTIAWLKHMKDLEGKLIIEGLNNMSTLVDAQQEYLRNKGKIETLELGWDCYWHEHHDWNCGFYEESELRITLKQELDDGKLVGADTSYCLLQQLQPHPNLKKLRLRGYPSEKAPRWMGDTLSLRSIQEIRLEACQNIQSLPFRNIHTLKHLYIDACSSIRVVQLEQLSPQLEILQILSCWQLELITGLGNLGMLATLRIFLCKALKSLTMDELHIFESTKPIGDSSHEMPHVSRRQCISSIRTLDIVCCPLLRVQPDGLILSGPCEVQIRNCPAFCNDIHTFCQEGSIPLG